MIDAFVAWQKTGPLRRNEPSPGQQRSGSFGSRFGFNAVSAPGSGAGEWGRIGAGRPPAHRVSTYDQLPSRPAASASELLESEINIDLPGRAASETVENAHRASRIDESTGSVCAEMLDVLTG